MLVQRIDHLVLTVRNLRVTCEFYNRVFGMEVITFGEGRTALRFGQQKINLHEIGHEFEPKALYPTAGSADLCFVTETALDIVMAHIQQCGVTLESAPVDRTGALGHIRSIYIRDPDGNLLEVSNYSSLGF
jgi:catechol 2,3-dioxygenase-like lactoylglutathione lyase family enzyme